MSATANSVGAHSDGSVETAQSEMASIETLRIGRIHGPAANTGRRSCDRMPGARGSVEGEKDSRAAHYSLGCN